MKKLCISCSGDIAPLKGNICPACVLVALPVWRRSINDNRLLKQFGKSSTD